MKKHITLILVLMTVCVAGIIGLQLFWNYQNYKSTVKTFDHDINEALRIAVDREMDQRQNKIVAQFKGWLADTSLITITCDYKNRDSNTVFHISDTHPKYKADKNRRLTFGLTSFKQKLKSITPQAKTMLINHFGDNTLKYDLKKGIVYNYTQMLGDSLDTVYYSSKVSKRALSKLFKQELQHKDINASFVLNPAATPAIYLTKPVNANFNRPYKKDWITAGFESPNVYFFREMKWLIITSLLLIGITLCCFTYTVKTLLSQQKLAQLKDDFIKNMTHELNTPLSSIKITTEALKSFNHSPETQSEYLDIISYQTDKLSDLTEQILNTNTHINTSSETWTTINPDEIIQQAITDLRPQLDKQQALITCTPTSPALYIKGEATSLLNAFTNVIDNALKYTTQAARLSIVITTKNGFAEITFADNGIGIPAEYQHKVFEKFFRVPQGNLHNVKGYGLGLSYVSQVIQQHKGTIWVSNNTPAGTIICIKLPLSA